MQIYLALDNEDTLDQSFNIVIITGVDPHVAVKIISVEVQSLFSAIEM